MKNVEVNPNLENMVKERNLKLDFFLSTYLPEARWVGNPNSPAIILGGKVMSCYMKNFHIILVDAPNGGKTITKFRLDYELSSTELKILKDWRENVSFHKDIYRLRVKNTNLFLTGFGTKFDPKSGTSNKKYPVFANTDERVYFSKDKAERVIDLHSDTNLILEII